MGLGNFLMSAGKALGDHAQKFLDEVEAAQYDARNWPDEKLIKRYKEARGAKRAGYAHELEARGYNLRRK